MGIALLYGLVFSVINILVDVTYGALDPRVSQA
jgi:ABC-type dipeptide/oligopeptide/nickel transport system permease component